MPPKHKSKQDFHNNTQPGGHLRRGTAQHGTAKHSSTQRTNVLVSQRDSFVLPPNTWWYVTSLTLVSACTCAVRGSGEWLRASCVMRRGASPCILAQRGAGEDGTGGGALAKVLEVVKCLRAYVRCMRASRPGLLSAYAHKHLLRAGGAACLRDRLASLEGSPPGVIAEEDLQVTRSGAAAACPRMNCTYRTLGRPAVINNRADDRHA